MQDKKDEQLQGEDSPAVLAYRVGQLEKSSREGFQKLSDKLDLMSQRFVTHKDVELVKVELEVEHKVIYEEIEDIKEDLCNIKKQRGVQNTLSTILGAIIALLVAFAFHSIFD